MSDGLQQGRARPLPAGGWHEGLRQVHRCRQGGEDQGQHAQEPRRGAQDQWLLAQRHGRVQRDGCGPLHHPSCRHREPHAGQDRCLPQEGRGLQQPHPGGDAPGALNHPA